MKNILPLLLLCLSTNAAFSQVVINEYSCANRNITDSFNEFEDWIELYNTSSSVVNLENFYLSDKTDEPMKWQFPAVSIPANGRLIVVCSGRNGIFAGIPHTNFGLKQVEAEDIVFSQPDGTLIESVAILKTQLNQSRGRTTDGGNDWGVFEIPSYNGPNSNAKLGYADTPELSLAAGFYNGSQSLTISVPDPTLTIRFTTNGAEPIATSPVYSGPIAINQTTVVRARAFSSNPSILPSFIETSTFLIDENHAIPVVSVCGTTLGNLFGGSWSLQPIGVLEYFNKDGDFVDEVVGDFNKHGNDSWAYPQRGVDFVGRDEAGYNEELHEQLFTTTDRDKFKRIMLKAGANDNYPFSNGAHIRDAYVQSLSQLGNLDLDERSSAFVAVYMNGQYWGLYDIREKVDDHDYTEYHYDQFREYKGSEDYIHFLKTWGGTWTEYGAPVAQPSWVTLRNFIQNNDMSDPANFAYVSENFNWKSQIDYFVINSVVVCADWLNWNTAWWRGTNPDGDAKAWRYTLWDMDNTFGHGTNYTGVPSQNPSADPCNVENLNNPGGQGHTQILNKLMDENEQVYQYYVTRYSDLMNTTFSCNFMLNVLDSMVAVMDTEMQQQIDRWGGSYAGWQNEVQDLENWINARCAALVDGMIDCYDLEGPYVQKFAVYPAGAGHIQLNSDLITSFGAVRNVYGGIETFLTAIPQGNYQFSHWVFNNTVVTDPTNFFQEIDFDAHNDIEAHFIDITETENQLIYYWHFNNFELVNNTPVNALGADYQLFPTANATMTYTGGDPNIDPVNDGSMQNLQLGEDAGKAARVRNPSEGRSLVFNLPTTGIEDINFLYSIKRTTSGQENHIISYSIDGINYINSGLTITTMAITPEYQIVSLDFTGIPAVNDNPNFHIKIEFSGNTNISNGNNRFDNISLTAAMIDNSSSIDEQVDFAYTVFPNPSSSDFMVSSSESVVSYKLVDMLGKTVIQAFDINQKEFAIFADYLATGVYTLELSTSKGAVQTRIIKQ